ncbi:hypothetical protein [Streptosporangium sp. NBC_01639]|uniref:hypothetical protein n=1 Tax=Streptosporangium sp. NBC_01639 TaxID=2975948 RepID=UPI00386CB138
MTEGVLSDVEPPTGDRFHLAGAYDAAAKTATRYLNGSPIKAGPVSFSTGNADTAVTLGTSMRGGLDDARVYQRPLSTDQTTIYGWIAEAGALVLQHRSISKPSELAFYRYHTPAPVPLGRLVAGAGIRWTIEERFQTGKNEAALDHYQVRLHLAWYRCITLAMLALAFLAVTHAALLDEHDLLAPDEQAGFSSRGEEVGARSIVVSANEIRRLFALLTRPPLDEDLFAGGLAGAYAIRAGLADATTSDNASKITKCSWSTNEHVVDGKATQTIVSTAAATATAVNVYDRRTLQR